MYECYQDEQNVYLVTEFCRGSDLAKVMTESGYLPESRVARIMRQVFAGLDYCHKLKIAHRYSARPQLLLET